MRRFLLAALTCAALASTAEARPLSGARIIPTSQFSNPNLPPADPADRLLCERLAAEAEVAHGIPTGVYRAILLRESQYSAGGKTFPHPWSLNYRGKDFYYPTKDAMLAGMRELRRAGVDNYDGGCAQRNAFWHPAGADGDLDAQDRIIADPAKNVAWGARWLATLMRGGVEEFSNTGTRVVTAERVRGHGNWSDAIAAYHAWEPSRGRAYAASVEQIAARFQGAPAERRSATRVASAPPSTPRDKRKPAAEPAMRAERPSKHERPSKNAVEVARLGDVLGLSME